MEPNDSLGLALTLAVLAAAVLFVVAIGLGRDRDDHKQNAAYWYGEAVRLEADVEALERKVRRMRRQQRDGESWKWQGEE